MRRYLKIPGFKRAGWLHLWSVALCVMTSAVMFSQTRAEPADETHGATIANQDPDAILFFEQQVRPILEKSCLQCHGGSKVSADRKSTRLNSSHHTESRMPSSA